TCGPSTYKIPGSRDVPPIFNVRLLKDAPNRAATIYRSKAIGEPPLMLAISVWLAIRDAIASLVDHKLAPRLDAPATPERVLSAIEELRAREASGRGESWRAAARAGRTRSTRLAAECRVLYVDRHGN